jgi:hypothetical protein
LRDEKCVHNFSWKLEGKGMLGKLGIDERTLLKKWILNKWTVSVKPGFICQKKI